MSEQVKDDLDLPVPGATPPKGKKLGGRNGAPKNLNYPAPPEWDPKFKPSFLRGDLLATPSNLQLPEGFGEMVFYWVGKMDQYYEMALRDGWRPATRVPAAHEVILQGGVYGRPNIDAEDGGCGSTVERHDTVLMWMPKHLHDKLVAIHDRRIEQSAQDIQGSYDTQMQNLESRRVHALDEPGVRGHEEDAVMPTNDGRRRSRIVTP